MNYPFHEPRGEYTAKNDAKKKIFLPKVLIIEKEKIIYKSRSLYKALLLTGLGLSTASALAVGARTIQNYNTEKSKVADGQMAHTNYGWLDTNHAIPGGPRALIEKVLASDGEFDYEQRGEKELAGGLVTLHLYASGTFSFDPTLGKEARIAVAYRVFREVTAQFEHTQAWTINTGVGDLNGNNLSFWRALHDKDMDQAQRDLGITYTPSKQGVQQFNKTVFYIPEDVENMKLRTRMGFDRLLSYPISVTASNIKFGATADLHVGDHHVRLNVLDNVTKTKKL